MAIYKVFHNDNCVDYQSGKCVNHTIRKTEKPRVLRDLHMVKVDGSVRETTKTIKPKESEIDAYMKNIPQSKTLEEYKSKREAVRELLTRHEVNTHEVKTHERKVCRRQTDAEYEMRERFNDAKERQRKLIIEQHESKLESEGVNAYLESDDKLDDALHKVYAKRIRKKDYRTLKAIQNDVREESKHYPSPSICKAHDTHKGTIYDKSQMDPQGYYARLSNGKRA